MIIQIKHRDSGAVLYDGDHDCLRSALEEASKASANLSGANLTGANLTRADLTRANLSGAYLTGANLTNANLTRADLSGAHLSGADLTRANLTRADLSGADLTRAKGVDRYRSQPLMMLLDQPGQIRAYKLVTADRKSPMAAGNGYAPLDYADGAELSVDKANEDPNESCGEGLHVATLPWCLSQRQAGQRILVVEFTANDIACIPNDASGKFRVRRLKVIGEKQIPEGAT